MTLSDLIARVEAATGPSLDLDHAVHDLFPDGDGAPLYTSSLDAVIGLVERVLQGGMFAPFGPFWHVSARAYVDGVFHEEKARADIKHPLTDCSAARWTGIAATPALALLLALLRSLQHQGEQT